MKNIIFRKPNLGTVAAAVLMAISLVVWAWLFKEKFLNIYIYVLSGQLFADPWSRSHVGTVLDQPTIGKWFFLFTLVTTTTFPYLAIVRSISTRKTRLQWWIFAVPTALLCLFSLCLLTIPFYWVIQYIDAMGVTARRIYGLIYGMGGYIVVLGFLYWAVRVPKEKDEPEEPAE